MIVVMVVMMLMMTISPCCSNVSLMCLYKQFYICPVSRYQVIQHYTLNFEILNPIYVVQYAFNIHITRVDPFLCLT